MTRFDKMTNIGLVIFLFLSHYTAKVIKKPLFFFFLLREKNAIHYFCKHGFSAFLIMA